MRRDAQVAPQRHQRFAHVPHRVQRFSRRDFLWTAGASAVAAGLVGCSPPPAAPLSTPVAPTTSSLIGSAPFYVAHRGGGGNWPEMTAYAYEQAARLPGLQALEISVCRSADGVLVCSHDPSTKRVCGVDYTIVDQTWKTLSSLEVSAAGTDDPGQPARPLTRFDDVVGRYIDRFVLFVEPKTPESVEPLLRRMTSFGAPERVVWKQPATADFTQAKRRGFTTWGYLLAPGRISSTQLSTIVSSPSIDMIGIQKTERERVVDPIVTAAEKAGKPVVMWPLVTEVERDRAVRLGCSGLMVSNIAGLLP